MKAGTQAADSAYMSHTLVDEWDRSNGIALQGAHRDDLVHRVETLLNVFTAVRDELLEVLETRAAREMEMLEGVARENDALREALEKAKETIKTWHGEVGWDIYDRCSPEMKPINAALALASSDVEGARP